MVKHGPGALDVTLEWTGGQPSFEVYRSADPSTVCRSDTLIGVTDVPSWIDVNPPGTVFYRVHNPASAEPPEVCNGVDDDCNGIIDDNVTDCDAGLCQARSEEHTSELQSRLHLVCRLLLEKKKPRHHRQ